jgi:polar amino acid transport system substrate-binding protein
MVSAYGRRQLLLQTLLVLLLLTVHKGGNPLVARGQATGGSDDAVWARVQATGTLRVGTAADYLPFGYHTENGQLDGYDIALSRALGTVLGVNVEITDMAFDGLFGALQLGQIDVAIAALSPTPERAALVDFTNIYYVGQDALIAGKGSALVINSVNELAGYRVGVQRGSAYADWLQETLVQPGIMPPENLLVYATIPPALRDMTQRRIDLIMMDAAPAETYVDRGSVKLVAEGFNKQRFAMAVPKGADTLREALNSALAELQADGQMNALAQRYLPLTADQLQPLPTPEPTATPLPSCIDGAAFVGHLTLDDQNMRAPTVFAPGQAFQKGWRLRNVGTCPWDSGYTLAYAGDGDPIAQMGGVPAPVVGTVAPGQEFAFYANLVAPFAPGTYRGFWSMRNSQGIGFGDRTWVGITVTDPTIPPPTPTPDPAVAGQFYADRASVRPGECVNFFWRVDNVAAVYFYELGADWPQFGVGGHDQRARCPVNTTTYELRVIDLNNTTTTRQITIRVEGEQVPQIRRFDLSPSDRITLPQCVTLIWDVQGQVNQVILRRNGSTLWASAPLIGSLQDCPQEPGTIDYVLEARGNSSAYEVHRALQVDR